MRKKFSKLLKRGITRDQESERVYVINTNLKTTPTAYLQNRPADRPKKTIFSIK